MVERDRGTAYVNVDSLGIFLSGGAGNTSPAASLGGVISSKLVRGMTPQYIQPMQGLVVEDATPENGEGLAKIAVMDGVAYYTPPGDLISVGVAVAEGERKLLGSVDKAVRVYRVPGEIFGGLCTFYLLDTMNGVLGMGNISNADRVAGVTHYRGIFLKALNGVVDTKVWVETDGQATYSLAMETAIGGAIQTIANEETAPSDIAWVDAVSEGTALDIGDMDTDNIIGVWIRRVFPPAGVLAAKENIVFNVQFLGV